MLLLLLVLVLVVFGAGWGRGGGRVGGGGDDAAIAVAGLLNRFISLNLPDATSTGRSTASSGRTREGAVGT